MVKYSVCTAVGTLRGEGHCIFFLTSPCLFMSFIYIIYCYEKCDFIFNFFYKHWIFFLIPFLGLKDPKEAPKEAKKCQFLFFIKF